MKNWYSYPDPLWNRIWIHVFQMWIRGSGSTITERWIRGSGSTFSKCGSEDPDPDPLSRKGGSEDPDPLFPNVDLRLRIRIRIHVKMRWIRNADQMITLEKLYYELYMKMKHLYFIPFFVADSNVALTWSSRSFCPYCGPRPGGPTPSYRPRLTSSLQVRRDGRTHRVSNIVSSIK